MSERYTMSHTGAELDLALSRFRANFTPETYTLPEQAVFQVSLDPTIPRVHIVWVWINTDYASGIMIRRKLGSLPQHTLDGVEVCTIQGTETTSFDDENFDIENRDEVGTFMSPKKWYYRAFPFNSIGQSQTHYQTTLNRGTANVNVYYVESATTLATLEVGMPFMYGHYGDKYLKWKVADIGEDYLSAILYQNDMPNKHKFDAPEPSNADSGRRTQGCNRWSTSNIRQWLHTSGGAGAWFVPQTDTDVCDSGLVSANGFLHDFTEAERGIIIPTSHVCALANADGGGSETVVDYVWLMSQTECGFGANNGIMEGTEFALFSGAGNTNNNRKEGFNTDYWLRSASSSIAYQARNVQGTGGSGNSGNVGANSYAVRPGLNLPLSTVIVWNDAEGRFEAQIA